MSNTNAVSTGPRKSVIPLRDQACWALRDYALRNHNLDPWAKSDGMPDPALGGRAHALVSKRKAVVCLAHDLDEIRAWLRRRKGQ